MTGSSFVHLRVHSEYSLLEAPIKIKKLVSKAQEAQMTALGLTDNGNMFGAVEFYLACKKAQVKPLLGLEVYVAEEGVASKSTQNSRLVLLAKDQKGYELLNEISTFGYKRGFYYKPRVDLDFFKTLNGLEEHLVCLSGGSSGPSFLAQRFRTYGWESVLEGYSELKKLFGNSLYFEISRTDPECEAFNELAIPWARENAAPLVATNSVYFLDPSDQIAQEVLICIASNRTLQDETRFRLPSDQFYLKSEADMVELFCDCPEALENTVRIAELCNFEFQLKDAHGKPIYHLPTFPTEAGRSLTEELSERSKKGLEERFLEADRRGEPVPETARPAYLERLTYELSVISKMGFEGYFLIVQDFINWAKEHGVPVGPGRGSGAGSLVAYSLRITDLDPIRHMLIFERFLNPERVSMPDFDIDFCQEKRASVIEYVTKRYGEESVSQIITFGKLQARAAVRDVGRVLGMTFSEVDEVAKLIPEKLGIQLKEALELEPKLLELSEINPTVGTLLDLSQRVEGLNRHAGIHAAGVIIADGNLVQHAPLYRGVDGENVVQYDMKHAETIGLIKFDFLGLKTLTSIHRSLKLIQEERGIVIRPEEIPMKDPGIYEIMSAGDNLGIFQFEGDGISDATRKIKPSSFEDITAINALYRPGPMAMIPTYTARKHGEEPVEYIFPELEEILKETYGIIVYQEQVQLIAAKIATYSLGEADLLRRAMGKKIKEEMDRQRERFLTGALENGFDKKKSEELFDLMNKFAEYGFNKSHAAAYCLVAAHTAWLKRYYPAEFYAGLMSTELNNTDNIVRYVKDARRHGIEVMPPHIQHSEFQFSVKKGKLYFGLGAIKGVGMGPAEAIERARADQPERKFLTLDQFFDSVDSKVLNKKTVEALIKAGALDGFGYHRAQLFQEFSKFIERSIDRRKNREIGQTSFFDLESVSSSDSDELQLADVAEWSKMVSLGFEKEVLGFYLTGHPLEGLEGLLGHLRISEIRELLTNPPVAKETGSKRPWGKVRPEVTVCGILGQKRELITKKGTRMAFASLEDLSGQIELVVFPQAFEDVGEELVEDRILLITGEYEKDADEGALPKILVNDIEPLDQNLKDLKHIRIGLGKGAPVNWNQFRALVQRYPGDAKLGLHLPIEELGCSVELELSSSLRVRGEIDFFDECNRQLGEGAWIEVQ